MQGIDILTPEIYERGVPYERFAELRRHAPVYFHDEPGGPGFWAITRYSDVALVLKDSARFSSQAAGTQIPDLPEGDIRRSPDILAVMDPPKHTRYRALINQSFTTSGLGRVEKYVQQLVTGLLNEAIERGRFDFVQDFAARLPMAIILKMVGVPLADEQKINRWVMTLLATDDPEYAASDAERGATAQRFMEYAHALAAERRKAPQDDLLSLLMAAEVDGVKLTYAEFGLFFMLLLAAGTDTPRLLVSSGMLALMQHADQRARLVENPALVKSAVEEVLRCFPPLLHFRRTAAHDTELGGQKIAAGQKVVVWMVSANRDEEIFRYPEAFDIERSPNDHLSFGHGPHFCIGNALARMSARIALTECVRRLPHLALAGPVERLRSNWLNGMKRMPVEVGRTP